MKWTTQQAAALTEIARWLRDPHGKQVFKLFGFAGTGKTTLAKHIANSADGKVCFCAFTGKAALVMKKKGCRDASTIHSLIYKPENPDAHPITYVLNMDGAAATASLIIVDEASMVNEEIGEDQLSFGVKILVLGDPFQLPPVSGEGFFTNGSPDVMLTQIRRQEADNPIIRLSIDIREGRRLMPGQYGDSRIITRRQLGQRHVMEADQVLCGMNATRQTLNQKIRRLKGVEDALPVVGDRLICLKNNKDKGLLNGSMWEATEVVRSESYVELMVRSLDEMDDPDELFVPNEFFYGTEKELPWQTRRFADEFTYGDAITVHKAQGSQFDNVILFDESRVFREHSQRHLYTGLTRAAERITIVV